MIYTLGIIKLLIHFDDSALDPWTYLFELIGYFDRAFMLLSLIHI